MSLDAYPRVSDWLGVDGDRLLVRTGKVDIGQRIGSALAHIVHEELTLPHALIAIAPVTTADSPDEGMTSGSNSIEQSGYALRLAAATLRHQVLAWAGDDWRLEHGALSGPGSNRPIPLLEFLADRDLSLPVDRNATSLGDSGGNSNSEGKSNGGGGGGDGDGVEKVPMRGIDALVTGRYRFLHDLRVPGMLHARVVRPPHAHLRLADIDDAVLASLHADGLRVHRDGSFLGVAGESEWRVVQAAERLARHCHWQGEPLPEEDWAVRLTIDQATCLLVRDGLPMDDTPPPAPATTIAASYARPYTMHASLAPSAALAHRVGETLHVTTHSQGIFTLRDSIAESLDLPATQVVLAHHPGSGCYGHNGADDAALDAALLAWAWPDTPVLLKWRREDEHRFEPYGPPMRVALAARTDAAGTLEAFTADVIGGTFRGRPRPGPGRAGPARLLANHYREAPIPAPPAAPNRNRQGGLQRNLDPAYRIAETRYRKCLVDGLPLRTSALRCLGAAANVFAIESFMDELALASAQDPFDYRLAHLDDARGRHVLNTLRDQLETRPPAAGRGIGYARYKNAMARVAVGVDLEVSDTAEIHLLHAVIVADAGRIVDRAGLEAQLEGGFIQGASWALHEQVTWDRDGVTSSDWDSYPVLRFDNVPSIEIVLLDRRDERSEGAGEASPGPTLAAIANAVYAATGLRLRRLPMDADALTAAALGD